MERIIKYYAYIKRSIRGPFYPAELSQIPGFDKNTLICFEKSIGQWKEAYLEPAFQNFLHGSPHAPQNQPNAEDKALRPVLEKALEKNSHFENEIKKLKYQYFDEKRTFSNKLRNKDNEIKDLEVKLKKAVGDLRLNNEHPSWETLYKTYKSRSEEKKFDTIQKLAERTEEVSQLKHQLNALSDEYDDLKRESEKHLHKTIAKLNSDLEEKEFYIKNHQDNMDSMLAKNEELQRIMIDERRDYEASNKNFCEEIGKLRSELKFRKEDTTKIKNELFDALNKIKEFESVENIKTSEQKEFYNALHSKIRLLSGYFENLENKVKYAFKKV